MLTACNSGKKNEKGTGDNPLLHPSELALQAPDFSKIKTEHFMPAFEQGMKEHDAQIDSIVNNPEAPNFENTIVAMEKSGRLLARTSTIFFGLSGIESTDEMRKVEEDISPKLSAHNDAIYLNDKLYQRVKTVYDNESKKLQGEDAKLLKEYYENFLKAGAALSKEDKDKLKSINQELAELSTKFGNMLTDATSAAAVIVDKKEDLAGLSDSEISKAASDAEANNHKGKYQLNITNTTQQPYLANLDNRALREKVLNASLHRADQGGKNDTRETILKIAKLRADKAALLGFKTFADWKLQDQMAKNSENVYTFLNKIIPAYLQKAKADAAELEAFAKKTEGADFKLEAWDWAYYADKLRKEKYDLNQNEVKEYFVLDSVVQNGIFYAANKLYGLTFKPRTDLPVYNSDVKVYDVLDKDGSQLAIFYTDYFHRPLKSGGAWMSNWVDQSKLFNTKPVIYNVCNYTKPAEGEPALLSMDEVETLFHEFGHALHGMFANQQYPSLSGTSVARDFVEMPSQFNEHWATDPAVLKNYAKHYKTGKVIPQELIDKMNKAARFNQAYSLGENLASVALDMAWHTIAAGSDIKDVDRFEQDALSKIGLNNSQIPPRYRSTYFRHIWSNGYSAGYYAYLWSEVLDNNAYDWFKAHGGLTAENGQRMRDLILSQGNTKDFNQIFSEFTGLKDPDINSLLKARGLK